MGFLDRRPFNASDPDGQALLEALMAAYDREPAVRELVMATGLRSAEFPWSAPMAQVWPEVLRKAADRGMLRRLITVVAREPGSAAYDVISRLVAEPTGEKPPQTPEGHELAEELRRLRLRTFGELPVDELGKRHPYLARLAETRHVPPAGGDRIQGLLLSAVSTLRPGALREAATALFGLTPATFGKPHGYRRDMARACFTPTPSDSTFQQRPRYLKLILDELAGALLDQAPDASTSPVRARKPALAGKAEHSGVRRFELEARVRAALEGQPRPVSLWGEAGNGKSHLARNMATEIAAALPAGLPVALIRRGNSAPVEEQTYQADLIACLVAAGQAPYSWSLPAQELAVRDLLAGPRCLAAVVLDDVTKATVDRLVPDSCAVPVIITSRTKLGGTGPEIRVDSYQPAEATAAARSIIQEAEDEQVRVLCTLLGNRPVAIDISARMVALGHMTLPRLLSALGENPPGTLDIAYQRAGESAERSLTRLYQEVYAQASARPSALTVLDALLWLSSGTMERHLLEAFLSRHLASEYQRIAYDAGLTWLIDIGLVHQQSDTLEINGLSQSLLRWHARTRIDLTLRDLMTTLRAVLAEDEPDEEADDQTLRARMYVKLVSWEHKRFSGLVSYLLGAEKLGSALISEHSWFIWEKSLGLFLDGSDHINYGILAVTDVGVMLWSSTDFPRFLSVRQAVIVLDLVNLFQANTKPELYRLRHLADEAPADAEISLEDSYISVNAPGGGLMSIGRFDFDVTPADGKAHKKVDPLPDSYTSKNSYSTWAFCGKRFNTVENKGGSVCADCDRFSSDPIRLTQIEGAMNALLNFLDLGSRLESQDAADFLAIRGKMQRLKGSPEDAFRSYMGAFFALRVATGAIADADTNADERTMLELGYGIAEEVAVMPAPFDIHALQIYNWLLTLSVARNSHDARIRYRRAQILERSGKYEEALADYDSVISIIDARSSVELPAPLPRILASKAFAESKMGRKAQARRTMQRGVQEEESNIIAKCALLRGSAAIILDEDPEAARADAREAARLLLTSKSQGKLVCDLLLGIAEIESRCGDRNGAREALRHAFTVADELDPPDADLKARLQSSLNQLSDQRQPGPDPDGTSEASRAAPTDASGTPGSKPVTESRGTATRNGNGSDLLEMELLRTSADQQSGRHLIVLREKNGSRLLQIYASALETLGISHAHAAAGGREEAEEPPYVLPHRMLSMMIEESGNRVIHSIIHMAGDGVYSAIRLSNGATVSAMPTDSISLAIWTGAPILAFSDLLDRFGFKSQADHEGAERQSGGPAEPVRERPVPAPSSRERLKLDSSAITPVEVVGAGIRATKPFLLMKESLGGRYLSLPISHAEAAAIDDAQLGMHRAGPPTHDLLWDVLKATGISLSAVTIDRTGGETLCFLEFSDHKTITAPAGDSIAIALRANASIGATARFIAERGVEFVEPYLEYCRGNPLPGLARMVGVGRAPMVL